MANMFHYPLPFQKRLAQGFTLIELSVVMAIVCILATGVVFMYSNPTAKVKGVAFAILTETRTLTGIATTRQLAIS
jgi:prepilin-type N-terminal cleavage/methylation domain-containing protein